MKRFICLLLIIPMILLGCGEVKKQDDVKAGFSRVKITPPVGTAMTGFGFRDYDPVGSKGVHDDLYVRALYLTDGKEKTLIMGFDLLFFSRDEADRFKGAIGRRINLSPGQILLNTSHTHTGPKVGSWDYTPSDRLYLQFIEESIVKAACEARDSIQEVTLWAGETRSKVPMNRRKLLPNGIIDFAPNPDGVVYDRLPFCLFKNKDGKPVYILFSVSCHPSTIKGNERSYYFSADFPGVAMSKLDEYIGNNGSLFLQGAGGDAKASVIGKGEEHWRSGEWDDIVKAGNMLADEVIEAIEGGLKQVETELRTHLFEMEWPMTELPAKSEIEEILANPLAHSESNPEALKMWAKEKLEMIDRGFKFKQSIPVTAHGLQLGKGLRLIGIEGEIVAELGMLINDFYKSGITFPMGYTDGTQLYLTTSDMLDEGGYEAESYWEYRHLAPLAKGTEKILIRALEELRDNGIL